MVTKLARYPALTYQLVQAELGGTKADAADVVMELEALGLLRLAAPAQYAKGKGTRRGRCIAPPVFAWVDE